ncbi:MAG: hypothetical protein ACREJD_11865 [Phycisphaerales bacterium]
MRAARALFYHASLTILEMDRPFTGLIQISDAPMRGAVELFGK